MTNNITLIQWISIAFILLPIVVLWANNRYLSARTEASQMLLGASLVFALLAAESSSVVAIMISVVFFTYYVATLVNYYRAAMFYARRQEPLPVCKRP